MSKMNNEIKNKGFVLLSRNLLEWKWYTEPNTCRFFIHCLLKANYKEKEWHDIIIPRGSFITSYNQLAKELNLTTQNIRTIEKRLISTNEITKYSTSKYTIITVNNYDLYQSSNKVINKQLTNNQQLLNKDNKVNNIYSCVDADEKIPYKEIIDYLNLKANKNFKHTTNQTKRLIKARFNEGFKLEDFKKVIDTKTSEWINDTKMSKYLRPSTLFSEKFESYLQEAINQLNGGDYSFDY